MQYGNARLHAGVKYFCRNGQATWEGVLRDRDGVPIGPFLEKPDPLYGDITMEVNKRHIESYTKSARSPVIYGHDRPEPRTARSDGALAASGRQLHAAASLPAGRHRHDRHRGGVFHLCAEAPHFQRDCLQRRFGNMRARTLRRRRRRLRRHFRRGRDRLVGGGFGPRVCGGQKPCRCRAVASESGGMPESCGRTVRP